MPEPITAGAVVLSTAIGAKSAKDAAKAQVKGQEKGLAASQAFSQQAIGQAKDYYNIGQRSAQAGFQSALDFFKNAQPAKYQPMIQSNVAAQRVIGQGAQQANNAILGLPVDMSFANQQTEFVPNYSAIQAAKVPVFDERKVEPMQNSAPNLLGQGGGLKSLAITTAGKAAAAAGAKNALLGGKY